MLKCQQFVFILLINVKMPAIVGILTFMSRINFMLHEKTFKTSGPGPGLENRTVFIIFKIRTLILNLSYVVAEWSKKLSCKSKNQV